MPGRDRSGPRGCGAGTGRGLGGCVTGGATYGRRMGGRLGGRQGYGRGLGAVSMSGLSDVDVDKQNLMDRLEELEAEVRSLRGEDKNSAD